MRIEGLDAVIDDLGKAGFRASTKIVATTKKAAGKIKDEARRNAEGMSHAPHYPRSITYDIEYTNDSVVAEIGPDKDLPQGALGNLLEFGSVNNAPHAHLGPAMDRELPEWLRHVEDAITPW